MGWSSGSEIMDTIITVLNKTSLPEGEKEQVYGVLIQEFSDHDADTLDECDWDPTFARVLKRVESAYYDDDEDPNYEDEDEEEYRGPKLT